MEKRPSKSSNVTKLYRPIERAVLANYLGTLDPSPCELADIDLSRPVDPDTWNEAKAGIAPLQSETDYDALMIENAVARICLESVQGELPQWAAMGEGGIEVGRSRRRRIRRSRRLKPVRLFTINWGDSGPGFSWPESYYVTPLDGYDVCVVTASADSPDANGYCDFAIGWFSGTVPDVERVRRVITARWNEMRSACGQERWAYLFDSAAIGKTTAEAWATAVWQEAKPRRRRGERGSGTARWADQPTLPYGNRTDD